MTVVASSKNILFTSHLAHTTVTMESTCTIGIQQINIIVTQVIAVIHMA